MKKLVYAIGFIVGFIAGFMGSAEAGVPCSVPFNLTNGTTADATQVMANYNAILACLSTSAAAAGSNNDITSLNALSPPITASCGVSGFAAANNSGTPNTQINISYTQASVSNTSNQVQTGGPNSVTLNLATVGAPNGLDTGALTASSFVYIWLIGNGSVIASLGSASSTTPVMPSGYTYKCRVGVWETGNTSLLLKLQAFGRRTQLMQGSGTGGLINAGALQTSTLVGTCSTAGMVLTTFAGIPPTANRAFGTVGISGGGEGYVSSFQNNNDINAFSVGTDNTAGNFNSHYFDLLLPSTQQFYICIVTAGAVVIGGWEDGVNAN